MKKAASKSRPTQIVVDQYKNLPEEVLFRIFEYLTVADRCMAGLVCQLWFAASKRLKFMDDIVVHIEKSKRVQKLFANTSRKFSHFYLSGLNNTDKKVYLELWNKIAPHTKSLSLCASFIDGPMLVHHFKTAPLLTKLEMSSIPLNISGNWKLEHFVEIKANNCIKNFIWIDDTSFISDKILIGFMQAFNGLEAILLGAKPILNLEELAAINDRRQICMGCAQQEARVETVVHFLEKNATTLKSLYLDEQKNWRTSYIPAVLKAKLSLNLTELKLLNNCDNMPTARDLNTFLAQQTQLKTLTLKHVRIDSSTLEIIFNISGLETLLLFPIRDHHNTFNEELAGLRRLRKLRELELFGFTSLTNQVFNTTMVHDLGQLQKVRLGLLPLITEKTFGKLVAKMGDLRHLAWIDCPNIATDKNLQVLFENCLRLESLIIVHSEKITERGFNGTFRINRLKCLKTLVLINLKNLDDLCLKHIWNPSLQVIRISGTEKITLKSVTQLLIECRALEVLQLPTEELAVMARMIGKNVTHRCKYIGFCQ